MASFEGSLSGLMNDKASSPYSDPTEPPLTDIDAIVSEQCADLSADTRYIAVFHHQ
jgi:hypothetical protein